MYSKNYGLILAVCIALTSCKPSSKVVTSPTKKSGTAPLTEQQEVEVQYTFYNAVKERLLGNDEKAVELFSKVLRTDGQNHAAMYELAKIYMEQRKANDAVYFSKNAVALNPSNEWYQLLLAELYQKTNKLPEAVSIYQQLSEQKPERIDFLFQWADALLYAGKPGEAIKVYDKIETVIGINKELTVAKQRIYLRLGKTDKAAQELEKYIQANPADPDGYSMLVDLYIANNMNDKAMETINRMKAVDSDNPKIALSMAEYYRSTGEREKSFLELKKAFASPQLNSDIKIAILSSYLPLVQQSPEMLDQALELSKILSDNHPNEANTHAVYGDFLSLAKKYNEAREQYRQCIAIDSKNSQAWIQLLSTEAELQDYVAMDKEGDEALEYFPDQSVFYLFSGIAKAQLNKNEEAAKVLVSGSKFVVDNETQLFQFYSNLGDVYNKLKNYTQSDNYFEKALKIKPDDATTLNNYAYYLSLRNEKMDRADEMSRKSNELIPNQASYEDTYAWILYKKGNYSDAKTWIEKAIADGGSNNGTILEHYGDILFKLGQINQAVENWQKAKETGDFSELLVKKITDRKLYE